MASEIDIDRFAQLIRAKRGKRGLRVVAVEIGDVTASTLSRIENGKVPDLNTFIRICRWLGLSPDYFMAAGPDVPPEANRGAPEIVSLHLRADRVLDTKTARALVNMVQLAVAAVEDDQLGKRKGKHAPGIQDMG